MSGYITPGLPNLTTLTGSEQIALDTQLTAGSGPETAYVTTGQLGLGAGGYQYAAPLTGATVAIAAGTRKLVLNPAGTIATLTVTMPATANLYDGFVLDISSSQTVTALTLTAGSGQTILQTPTAITVSTTGSYGYRFIWVSSISSWIRLQ